MVNVKQQATTRLCTRTKHTKIKLAISIGSISAILGVSFFISGWSSSLQLALILSIVRYKCFLATSWKKFFCRCGLNMKLKKASGLFNNTKVSRPFDRHLIMEDYRAAQNVCGFSEFFPSWFHKKSSCNLPSVEISVHQNRSCVKSTTQQKCHAEVGLVVVQT